MKTKDYRELLLKDLRDPDYAAEYLTACFEEGGKNSLLTALRDVVEALGGISKISKSTGLGRTNLYKILDKKGNPTFTNLLSILDETGLGITFYRKKA